MLNKKLQKLVNNHIITLEQAEKIMRLEQERRTGIAWNTLFSLAGIFIGLGFMLLIGANWYAVPDALKIVGDFMILGAFVYGVYWSVVNKRNTLKELFLILSFLMIGGTIGLIAQIFNLSGGWHSFALVWSVLSVPFVLLSHGLIFNITWLLLLGTGVDWRFLELFYWSVSLPTMIGVTLICGALAYAGQHLYQMIDGAFMLPKAFSKLALFYMYVFAIFGCAHFGFWGHVFVFLFLAVRMALAFKTQHISSFRNNAIIAELYIVYLFISSFGDLFLSGLGFIFAGVLLLTLIWMARKTARYINGIEAFHAK